MPTKRYEVTSPILFKGKIRGVGTIVEMTFDEAVQYLSCVIPAADNPAAGLELENQELNDELRDLVQEKKSLETNLQTVTAERDTLLQEKGELASQLAEANDCIVNLNRRIAELTPPSDPSEPAAPSDPSEKSDPSDKPKNTAKEGKK